MKSIDGVRKVKIEFEGADGTNILKIAFEDAYHLDNFVVSLKREMAEFHEPYEKPYGKIEFGRDLILKISRNAKSVTLWTVRSGYTWYYLIDAIDSILSTWKYKGPK